MDTKHIKRVLLFTTMAIFIASGVYAEQIPLFELSYGDGSVQFFSDGDYSFTGDGSVSVGELESFADGSVRIGEFYFSQPGVGEVLLEDLFLKYDPEISVSFGITDLGDPSLFALSVITPIDPVGTPNVVAGSLTGYLPDFNQDGVSPTPYYTEGLMPAFVGYGGSPLTDIFYLGDLCSAGAGSADFLCGFYTYGPVAGPVPLSDPWDYLGISINLTLSGVGDSAIFSATASIDPGTVPVPEPATMLLFGSGLLGLAGLKRKIKKS